MSHEPFTAHFTDKEFSVVQCSVLGSVALTSLCLGANDPFSTFTVASCRAFTQISGRNFLLELCGELRKSCPPRTPETPKNEKQLESDSKVSFGLPQSNPKITPKVTFCPEKTTFEALLVLKSCFRGYFWVTLGETPNSLFESLSSYF